MVIHEGSWAQDDKNKIILGTTSSQQQTVDGVIQIVYLYHLFSVQKASILFEWPRV